MSRFKMPPADVPVIDLKTGYFTPDYFDFFKNLERFRLVDLADVSTTTPSNGQVLIYASATKTFNPGAN